MEFTPELISELKSLFIKDIGHITETSSIRLLPLSEPCLAFSGEGIRQENGVWILYFGEIPSISRISRTVSIQNAGQIPLRVGVQGGNPCIGFQWKNGFRGKIEPGGDFQEMEIVYRGKELTDEPLDEPITFIADFFPEDQISGLCKKFILQVIATPHNNLPFGIFDFNGLPDCTPHNFGVINPSDENVSIPEYCLSIINSGNQTLTFHLDQIPSWLNIRTEPPNMLSETGKGAVEPGKAACIILISPLLSTGLSKSFQSRMILETNEFRPEFKRIEMVFRCRQQISGPYIRPGKEGPIRIQALTNTPGMLEFPIENLGEKPAAIRFEGEDLIEAGTRIVPAARNRRPGHDLIKTRILTKDKKPGKLSAAFKISVQNNKQSPLVIPLEADIIEISCVPDMADFGTVSPGDSPEQKFVFRASGGHKLSLKAIVREPLKESLRFSADKSGVITIRLTDSTKQDNPLYEYNGPGIQVRDPQLGYEHTLHIRFRRATPVLETDPKINLGDVMNIGKIYGHCLIQNKGDGTLKAKIRSLSSDLIIPESSAFVELEPSEKTCIDFFLTLGRNVDNETIQRAFVIQVNDPRLELAQKIFVFANMIQAVGRLCPQCPYNIVLPLSETYCRFCGTSLEDAKPVDVEGIKVCAQCGRQYKTDILFCPIDGKPLKPLKT